MAETSIGTSSPLSVKLFSTMLFAESIRNSSLLRTLSHAAEATQKMALAKRESIQTPAGMPIVVVTDLTRQAGDRITVDLFHNISGKPFMGAAMAEGRGTNITFDTNEFRINQTRFPVQTGDTMSQKRTKHNLRMIGKSSLVNYFSRLTDQRGIVHLAGARGDDTSGDWIVPPDTDSDFAEIMINPVTPPTSNRYFVAGGGTAASDVNAMDPAKLEDFDVITTRLREEAFPIPPIKYSDLGGGMDDDDDQIWCALVSHRVWHYILAATNANALSYRKFIADATMRKQVTKHPLFNGTCGMWNGMLIKRVARPIRFNVGATVKTINSTTGAEQSSTTTVAIDRTIILGAQALALVKGNATARGSMISGASPTFWSEKELDHGDKLEVLGGMMDGMGKIRFEDSDNKLTDYGVAVLDSYAPDPESADGATLRGNLD